MTGQRFKSVWDALPPEVRPMTCQTCIHRLDVTLWGLWLATGCRMGLVLRRGCPAHERPGGIKTLIEPKLSTVVFTLPANTNQKKIAG